MVLDTLPEYSCSFQAARTAEEVVEGAAGLHRIMSGFKFEVVRVDPDPGEEPGADLEDVHYYYEN